jgi:hypothetical protein
MLSFSKIDYGPACVGSARVRASTPVVTSTLTVATILTILMRPSV